MKTSDKLRESWEPIARDGAIMSTKPYPTSTPAHTYPLVLWARMRHKNTAELTASELRQALRWCWKVEPIKHKLCNMPDVRKHYWEKTAQTTTTTKEQR